MGAMGWPKISGVLLPPLSLMLKCFPCATTRQMQASKHERVNKSASDVLSAKVLCKFVSLGGGGIGYS